MEMPEPAVPLKLSAMVGLPSSTVATEAAEIASRVTD